MGLFDDHDPPPPKSGKLPPVPRPPLPPGATKGPLRGNRGRLPPRQLMPVEELLDLCKLTLLRIRNHGSIKAVPEWLLAECGERCTAIDTALGITYDDPKETADGNSTQ